MAKTLDEVTAELDELRTMLGLLQVTEKQLENVDVNVELPVGTVGPSTHDLKLARWVRSQGIELVKCKTRDQRRALLTYIGDTIDGLVGVEKAAQSIEQSATRRTTRVDRQLNTPYQQAYNALNAVFGE